MKKKLFSLKSIFVLALILILPLLSFAQVPGTTSCDNLDDLLQEVLCKISNLFNLIIPILITLGLIYFIWGVISYAIAKDEEAKTKGRSAMISGIIALAVITSVWGLVALLKEFFLIGGGAVEVPQVENPFKTAPL